MRNILGFGAVLSVDAERSSIDKNVAQRLYVIVFAATFYLLLPTSPTFAQGAPVANPLIVLPPAAAPYYVLPPPVPYPAAPLARLETGSYAPLVLEATPPTRTFGGVTLGIGFGLSFDVQGQKRVVSVSAPNNIVRVDDTSSNVIASVVVESHYFFVPHTDLNLGTAVVPAYTWGHGPFVAIDAGTSTSNNSLIYGFSIGWMIGFRQPHYSVIDTRTGTKGAIYDSSSWNIGLGFRVDPQSKVLGDGLVANMPLPPGDTVRTKTVPRYGVMLLSSYGF